MNEVEQIKPNYFEKKIGLDWNLINPVTHNTGSRFILQNHQR